MIDHIIINVSNLSASFAFYRKALAPLGYSATSEYTTSTGTTGFGFGLKGEHDFFIQQGAAQVTQCHIAFYASTRAQVEEFYAAGLAAGGRDNGKPELTPDHGPDYYSAYVFDPDGYNIEVVCAEPVA